MRRLCLLLTISLGLTGLGLTGLGLPAAAAGPAVQAGTAITSPADGATLPSGYSTFTVQLNEPAGLYELTVTGCDYGYYESAYVSHSGTPQSYSLALPPLTCGGSYSAALVRSDTYEYLDTNYFEVRVPAPAPRIASFSVSEREIWPMERDGYKDDVSIYWESQSYEDAARVEILSSSGAVVAGNAGWVGFWVWKGKNRAGRFVKPGRYRVRLTVTNADHRSVSSTKALRVSHRMAPGTMTYQLAGTRTTTRSTRGNCFQNGYDGTLTLDCWGGNHAEATYVFRIPRKAHHLKWRVFGEENCCDRGKLSVQGRRTSPTRFRITVRVTDWRSYTIAGVHFRYAARMMFRPTGRLGPVAGDRGGETTAPRGQVKKQTYRRLSACRRC